MYCLNSLITGLVSQLMDSQVKTSIFGKNTDLIKPCTVTRLQLQMLAAYSCCGRNTGIDNYTITNCPL